MRRAILLSVGLLAGALTGAILVHGCGDDRAQVAAYPFTCNPSSSKADADCGPGFVCYAATQTIGGSICVPICDPAKPDSCHGACTAAGECLTRCTIAADLGAGGCPAGLSCVHTTVSPIEIGANDGVCLPVSSTCERDDQCNSSVFSACSSSTSGNAALSSVGSVCIQPRCQADGTACEPGSSCISGLLPLAAGAPDVCTPNCVPRQVSNERIYECLPGFSCISTVFPQQSGLHVCTPGFGGWLCADSLGCLAGTCDSWGDVAPNLAGLKTCAPKCITDDDCALFDRGGNPSAVSKLTCHAGRCRALVSMAYSDQCFQFGQACKLDSGATCTDPTASTDGGAADGGTRMSVGGYCKRECATDDQCAPLTVGTHVPHVCDRTTNTCTPAIPFVAGCRSDASCIGDLKCIPALGTCTRTCSSDDDCAKDPALSSAFACPGGLCVPKYQSGVRAPASLCLSGHINPTTLKCASPAGWSCDDPAQCLSDDCQCTRTSPLAPCNGRCGA